MNNESNHDLTCNCRYENCPLEGSCNVKNIVYEGEVMEEGTNKKYSYVGITAEEFRKRYAKHKQSFSNSNYKNETALSKKVWEIKEKEGKCPTVNLKILRKSKSYTAGDKYCLLCTEEKYEILNINRDNLLNNRREIYNTCRYRVRVKIERIHRGKEN